MLCSCFSRAVGFSRSGRTRGTLSSSSSRSSWPSPAACSLAACGTSAPGGMGGGKRDVHCRLLSTSVASNGLRPEAHPRHHLPLTYPLPQPRDRCAKHLQHHPHAHVPQEIRAGLWMSRLTSCNRPGKRRLSTTKARSTALARTYPHIDVISPASTLR